MALGYLPNTFGLNGGGAPSTPFPGTPTVTATAGGTTTLTGASATSQVFTGTLNQTVVLPASAGAGKYFVIKNTSTGTVTVQRAGTDTIDGSVQVTLAQNQSVDLLDSAAGKWVIV